MKKSKEFNVGMLSTFTIRVWKQKLLNYCHVLSIFCLIADAESNPKKTLINILYNVSKIFASVVRFQKKTLSHYYFGSAIHSIDTTWHSISHYKGCLAVIPSLGTKHVFITFCSFCASCRASIVRKRKKETWWNNKVLTRRQSLTPSYSHEIFNLAI